MLECLRFLYQALCWKFNCWVRSLSPIWDNLIHFPHALCKPTANLKTNAFALHKLQYSHLCPVSHFCCVLLPRGRHLQWQHCCGPGPGCLLGRLQHDASLLQHGYHVSILVHFKKIFLKNHTHADIVSLPCSHFDGGGGGEGCSLVELPRQHHVKKENNSQLQHKLIYSNVQ